MYRWVETTKDETRYPYSSDAVRKELAFLISESELPGGPATAQEGIRRMASASDVAKAWWESLVKLNKFDSLFEMTEPGSNICWGCGMHKEHATLERAHILARSAGGTDDATNLHLLCPTCHKTSENLTGRSYWSWFMWPWRHYATYEYFLNVVSKNEGDEFSDMDNTIAFARAEAERLRHAPLYMGEDMQ